MRVDGTRPWYVMTRAAVDHGKVSMEETGGPRRDDLGLLRRQVVDAARAVVRPGAYVGAAREAALTAVHLTAYPFGFLPPVRLGAARPAVELARQLLLSHDPVTACMPVVLVHGYFHNRTAFIATRRALERAGFRHVVCFSYNPLRRSIPQLALQLRDRVDRALAETGASHCQLVGHSMGGLVVRWFIQRLGGDEVVDSAITLGTPHRGTYSAHLGAGPAVRQMRPGSSLLRELDASTRGGSVRWVAFYSDLDVLVTPAASAKLAHPALHATNLRIRDTGHLSLLLSGDVVRDVVEHLADRGMHRSPHARRAAASARGYPRTSGA